MQRQGHYGAALLAYAPVGFLTVLLGFQTAAVGGGVLAVGLAMLPDWDLRLPGVSHRGKTHTVHFAVVVAAGTGLLGAGMGATTTSGAVFPILGGAILGACTGAITILSHIWADALTPMGVEPLGRDGPHISYEVCRADNRLCNYALLGGGMIVALVAFYAGRAVGAILGT